MAVAISLSKLGSATILEVPPTAIPTKRSNEILATVATMFRGSQMLCRRRQLFGWWETKGRVANNHEQPADSNEHV
jgi:hypothetical protein